MASFIDRLADRFNRIRYDEPAVAAEDFSRLETAKTKKTGKLKMETPETEDRSWKMSENELNKLFEAYLPKLIKLAEFRISAKFKGKFDENDIAGTVCRSVFRRWKEGKFKFDDDAEFWRLLVTVAKRKICNKVRDFSTQSRSIANEVSEVASSIISAPDPDPAEAVAFEESLAILAGRLDDQEKQVFAMRMEGREYHEIADLIGVSERTVRRKMSVIRERLEGLFDINAKVEE